jgi:hypothetical protein
MFFKKLELSPGFPEVSVEEIMAKHKYLKKLSLPVVPTLRFDKDEQTLIMTDMSCGGTKTIVDRHQPLFSNERLRIENLEQIKSTIRTIPKIAYAYGNGVYLNRDAYAVVVDHGIGDVCLLDIGILSYNLRNGASNTGLTLTLYDAQKQADRFIDTCLSIENPLK